MVLQKDGSEEIVYKGKIFEIVKQPMKAGDKSVVFEIARRAPGVRLIIIKENKILLTREFRNELSGYDYRLPGGKVFDTLEEYKKHRDTDLLPFAIEAGKREATEEVGLTIKNISHFTTATSGATGVWDLFYFLVHDFEENKYGQKLETGEDIQAEWKTFDEVRELCKDGLIQEDRTVGVLFRFFLQHPEK